MIPIDECRKILGKVAEGMTDKEIEAFRNGYYEIISTLLDEFEREEKNLIK